MKFVKLLPVLVLLVACKKDPVEPTPEVPSSDLQNSMLVLCEGLFQHNNSTVSWVNFENDGINANFFEYQAGRNLGDTGNDMQRYGGKVYVVVNVSSTIEVLDTKTFKPVAQIEMQDGGQAKQPRSIAFANGKAYVSCYDGYVDVIDTITLTVTQRIPVGSNPEGVAVFNNQLYVANSGGLNFPDVDSTVSVIDLTTHAELTKITVGANPGAVLSNGLGDIFVISRGDYGAIPSRLKRINTATNQLEETYAFDITGLAQYDSYKMLVYNATGISRFDYQLNAIDQHDFIDISNVQTLYAVAFNPADNNIYVMDAMGYTNLGFIRKYSNSGTWIKDYQVGLNPSKIIFYD